MQGRAKDRRRGSPILLSLSLMLFMLICKTANAQATPSALRSVAAVAYNAKGDLYIADALGNQVFKATLAGDLVRIAGTGVQGFSGDGGAGLAAELDRPQGLAVMDDGTLLIADTGNARIRSLSPQGMLTTFAGIGTSGFSGDAGAAVLARLRQPTALALEPGGALLICDTGNHRLRRVQGGRIATVAGNGTQGFAGDGGLATAAALDSPMGVAAAADGRIYIADTRNHRVRVVGINGVIVTIAGTGASGFAGDESQATSGQLSSPRGLALTSTGNLLIADAGNQRLRQIDQAGVLSTVAGSGAEGSSQDGDAAAHVSLRLPRSVSVSPMGFLALADDLNATVRVLPQATVLYQPAALVTGRSTAMSLQTSETQVYGQGGYQAVLKGVVGTPQGSVLVSKPEGSESLASVSNGLATLDLSGLPVGTHQLTVQYLGDGLNPASSAASWQLAVSPLALSATADGATISYGSPLPSMTGSLSGVLPQDEGQVQLSLTADLPPQADVGTYPITPTLIGSKAQNYTVKLNPTSARLQIVKAGSNTILATGTTIYAGLAATLRASVAPQLGGLPTGVVHFLDGNQVIATADLIQGTASATYASPPAGPRSLSVQYLGDKNFLPSVSAAVQTHIEAIPDFALTPTGQQAASVSSGGVAKFTFAVGAQPGPFTGAVSLSAAGLPAGAVAAFSPPQVIPGAGTADVTLSIQLPETNARTEKNGKTVAVIASCFSVGLLLFRRRRSMPYLCGACCLAMLLTGCGARTVGEDLRSGVEQTYTVQVTGTATNLAGAVITHAASVALTVSP